MVKIKGVKVTPEKTVRYITDKEKTMDRILIDGINCTRSEDTIIAKMKCYRKWYQSDRTHKNLSFHVIHAFSDKENISAEKAHEISMEWFRLNFPSDVLAVAATHNNTNSIHTHFVVNNVSLNGKGLSFDKTWQRRAIECSNELCKRYNLVHSITDIDKPRSIKYKNWWEYQQATQGNSWKEILRKLIDQLIKIVKTVKELFSELRKRGYEVNETEKNVTIKPKDIERTMNIKTLGRFYSPEQLEKRVSMANTSREALVSEYSELEGKLKAIKNWKTKASKVPGMEEKIKDVEEKEKALKERQKEIRQNLKLIEKERKEDVSR